MRSIYPIIAYISCDLRSPPLSFHRDTEICCTSIMPMRLIFSARFMDIALDHWCSIAAAQTSIGLNNNKEGAGTVIYQKKVRCWIKSYRYSYFSYTSSIKFSVVVYYEHQAVLVVFRLDSLPREVWRFEWQMRVLAFPCRNHAIW